MSRHFEERWKTSLQCPTSVVIRNAPQLYISAGKFVVFHSNGNIKSNGTNLKQKKELFLIKGTRENLEVFSESLRETSPKASDRKVTDLHTW